MRQIGFEDGEVTGEAFLGRREEMERLRRRVLKTRNSTGTAIIGPIRIGKGSLVAQALPKEEVQKLGMLWVRIVLQNCTDAFHFWSKLCRRLRQELREHGKSFPAHSEEVEEALDILAPALALTREQDWYDELNDALEETLQYLAEAGIRLVLILDEFDSATRIFGRNSCYYSFLRSMSTDADYLVSCVLLARHELHTIELRERGDSNFAGAYKAYALRGMDEEGVESYKNALKEGGLDLDSGAWENLHYYAGCNPYLLSLLGNRLLELCPASGSRRITEEDVDESFRACRRSVEAYCMDLRSGMEKDGDLVPLMGATVGPCIGVSKEDRQRMQDLGYLDEKGVCAISPYFTEFLRTVPMDRDPKEGIMAAEQKLRSLVEQVYPWLSEIRYVSEEGENSLWRQIEKYQKTCPDFDLLKKRKTILRTMRQSFTWWGEISLLDSLSLGYTLNEIILPNWEKFQPLMGERDLEEWRDKLELIEAARGPLAHANGNMVERRRNELKLCCDEVLALR